MRNELSEIEICCKGIISSTRSLLTWEWDDYIGTFLAAFSSQQAPRVADACDKYFMSRWDTATIDKIPPSVLAISESLGGLRSAQRLYASRPGDFVMAYGAWWPWGDEKTISLRIGMVTYHVPAHAKGELFREFSDWFTHTGAKAGGGPG